MATGITPPCPVWLREMRRGTSGHVLVRIWYWKGGQPEAVTSLESWGREANRDIPTTKAEWVMNDTLA